jgi:hypothetical protein
MIPSALAVDADIERVPFSDLSPQWREIAQAEGSAESYSDVHSMMQCV